jgi:mono/diheme cytochrome c family protein
VRLLLLLVASGVALAAPAKPAAKPPAKPNDTTVPTKRPSDREIGETTWRTSCSACHGASGRGDGPASAAVPGGVASLEGHIPEDDEKIPRIVDVVEQGKGRMPAFSETIERGDMRLTVLYVRDVLAGRVSTKTDKPEKPDAPEADEPNDGDAQ